MKSIPFSGSGGYASETLDVFPKLFFLMQILFSGGQSAPYMALLLVHIQYLSYFSRQRWINLFQPVSAVLVYRTLTYPKPPGRLAHGRLVVDNIICHGQDPLFDIVFQRENLPQTPFLQCMITDLPIFRNLCGR